MNYGFFTNRWHVNGWKMKFSLKMNWRWKKTKKMFDWWFFFGLFVFWTSTDIGEKKVFGDFSFFLVLKHQQMMKKKTWGNGYFIRWSSRNIGGKKIENSCFFLGISTDDVKFLSFWWISFFFNYWKKKKECLLKFLECMICQWLVLLYLLNLKWCLKEQKRF